MYPQRNLLLIRLGTTVWNFTTKQTPSWIFSTVLLKLPKLPFRISRLWWLLLLLDKISRYYEHCNKQTPPKQFPILINDSDSRESDLHENLKRKALIEQTLVVDVGLLVFLLI